MSARLSFYIAAFIAVTACVVGVYLRMESLREEAQALGVKLMAAELAKADAELAISEQNLRLVELEKASLAAAATHGKEKAAIEKRYATDLARQQSALKKDGSCEKQLALINSSQRDFLNIP